MKNIFYIVILLFLSCGTNQRKAGSVTINSFASLDSLPNLTIINVKDFGAIGDGVTDDYNSLLAAARACKDSSKLVIPRGIYYVAEYHTRTNAVANISFNSLQNFAITGDSAVILLNGNFRRAKDYQNGAKTNWYSYNNSIIPLSFFNCKNFYVSGLEINGNVNQMQRDSGVVESAAYLINLNNCQNVTIENMNLHHAQTDGIYIIGDSAANIEMNNVTSSNNARQGMSIINLKGGLFNNCSFANTGFTGGSYGWHLPGAGIDIEPRGAARNIIFDDCSILNNRGGEMLVTAPWYSANITVKNCTIDAINSLTQYQMILNGKHILIDSCIINTGTGNIRPVWSDPGSTVTISNSTIQGMASGILSVSYNNADTVIVTGNTLTFTDTLLSSYFPYIRGSNLVFTNNHVNISVSNTNNGNFTSLIEAGNVATGNIFCCKAKVSFKDTKTISGNKIN